MSITTVTAAGDTCLPNIGLLASDVSEALGHGGPVQLGNTPGSAFARSAILSAN